MKSKSDYEVTFEGTDVKASFFVRGHNTDGKEPLFLNVSFYELPEGSVVTVGDSTKTAADHGSLFFKVDFRDRVSVLSLSNINNKRVDLDIPMTIKLAGYKEQKLKVPKLEIAAGVAAALATVRDRPITFDGEPAASGPPKTLASVEAGTSMSRLVVMGPAKKLADIDLIGVRTRTTSGRTKKCDGYKKIKGTVTIKMQDYKVEIYDRRKGTVLKTHVVEAPDECPMFVSVDKHTKTASGYASASDVDKWLREQLRGLASTAGASPGKAPQPKCREVEWPKRRKREWGF